MKNSIPPIFTNKKSIILYKWLVIIKYTLFSHYSILSKSLDCLLLLCISQFPCSIAGDYSFEQLQLHPTPFRSRGFLCNAFINQKNLQITIQLIVFRHFFLRITVNVSDRYRFTHGRLHRKKTVATKYNRQSPCT